MCHISKKCQLPETYEIYIYIYYVCVYVCIYKLFFSPFQINLNLKQFYLQIIPDWLWSYIGY